MTSDDLTGRVQSLRAAADAAALAIPDLDAVRRTVGDAAAALVADVERLADEARRRIDAGRERLEHAAAELESAGRAKRRRRARATHTETEVRALIADVITDLPRHEAERCRRELPFASATEIGVMTDLVDEGLTHDQLVHLLEGGHLLVPGRDLLARWAVLPGVTPRTSSHYHPHDQPAPGAKPVPRWLRRAETRVADAHAKPMFGQQYGLQGRFVHEVLFGPGPFGTMFVQLERAAPSKARLPEHIGDWLEYRATHRNQGPYGSSDQTDAVPMRAPVAWTPDPTAALTARIDAAAGEARRIATRLAAVVHHLADQPSMAVVVRSGQDVAPDPIDETLGSASSALDDACVRVTELAARLDTERV